MGKEARGDERAEREGRRAERSQTIIHVLIETTTIWLEEEEYQVRYFKNINLNGVTSYSLEFGFSDEDKFAIDDLSLWKLRHKLDKILPAVIYSRKMDTSERLQPV